MANDIVQTIAEARVDARSLSEFVFKPADFMVARRLAPSVRTLQYYVDFFNTLQSNIATSVSAAQSSLNNSVAEAQGKVAYIETTVQDAINNTAVEGGVLADTFVTATAYGSGSIARTQREINAERVSVHDFGAIGDGTLHTVAEWTVEGSRIYFPNLAAIQAVYPKVTALTDSIDGTAIQACIDYCTADSKLANSVMGRRYIFNKQLHITCPVDFNKSTFEVVNTFNDKFIVIDSGDVGKNFYINIEMKLPIVMIGSTGGARPLNSSGVYIDGMRNCTVHFDTINGFYNNLHLYSNASNKYISYNDFHFHGSISGGASNVLMEVEDTGWVNQCQWFGGQFGTFTPDVTNHEAVCIRIKNTFGGNNGPNGHTFIGCSMEGSFYRTISYELDPLITNTYFSSNRWVACRFEASKVFQFNRAAKYDSFIGCMVGPDSVFVDNRTPNMVDCTRMSRQIIDVGTLIGVDRESLNTHYFEAGNSGGAMALSVGLAGRINAGITSGGTVAVFNPSFDMSIKNPCATLKSLNGRGCLSLGSGAEGQTLNSMYSTGQDQVKIDFNMFPVLNDTVILGTSGAAYKNITSVQLTAQKGISTWGVAAPSSKPSVTGLKTPTTIAEQKVVTDSLIAALASYGLITDNRT